MKLIQFVLFVTFVFGSTGSTDDAGEKGFKYKVEDKAVPDEYIVTLKKDILSSKSGTWLQSFVTKMKDKYGCQVKRHFTFEKLKSFRIKGAFEKIKKLRELAEVAFVEENLYVKAIQATTNTTVCYEENTGRNLWGLSRLSRRDKIPILFRSYYNWGSNDDGSGVDAYILDSGIDISHPDFEGRASWGYTASSIIEKDEDFHGHGTHVAGTVGGKTYGVAKGVNLIAVKVLNQDGVGNMADVLEGIQYAYDSMRAKETETGKKAKVVLNLSLGGEGRILALEQIINEATAAGMVIVVAAGNEYDDACLYTPSHISSAITVGATNINDQLSEFSNYGTCEDILAPGEGILSTYLGGTTAIFQGTSMACPHVAGAAARYLSRFDPAPTAAEIKDMMSFDATMDRITLGVGEDPGVRLTTPNRLLYMTCGATPSTVSRAGITRYSLATGAVMIVSLLVH